LRGLRFSLNFRRPLSVISQQLEYFIIIKLSKGFYALKSSKTVWRDLRVSRLEIIFEKPKSPILEQLYKS